MDTVISSLSVPRAAPMAMPDARPTADAAAIARDPQPNVPMAIPASMGQSGAVNASRIVDPSAKTSAIAPPERVLKPYGVVMLPERASSESHTTADVSEELTDSETEEPAI